jgi:hypothetical protein
VFQKSDASQRDFLDGGPGTKGERPALVGSGTGRIIAASAIIRGRLGGTGRLEAELVRGRERERGGGREREE